MAHCNKVAKIKDLARIVKATREKQQITYKGTHIRLSADCSRNSVDQKGGSQ